MLMYLQKQEPVGLVFNMGKKVLRFDPEFLKIDETFALDVAVDSDLANDPDTLKSVVGTYVMRLNGAAVSWRSKLVDLETSTFHAEYIEAYEGDRVVVWSRMLLTGIGFKIRFDSELLEDNMAAEKTANGEGISDASKHIQLKYQWVRECVQKQLLIVNRVNSKDNPADSLTKAPTTASLEVTRGWSFLHPVKSFETNDEHSDQGG